MVNAALAFMFLFLLWMRLSQIIFALTFPSTAALDMQGLFNATFFTVGGWEFLALFLILGACLAALAFMGGAFALPTLPASRCFFAGAALCSPLYDRAADLAALRNENARLFSRAFSTQLIPT
jgi:hypothetical protein